MIDEVAARELVQELRDHFPGQKVGAADLIGALLDERTKLRRVDGVPDSQGDIIVWSGDPPHEHMFSPTSTLDALRSRVERLESTLHRAHNAFVVLRSDGRPQQWGIPFPSGGEVRDMIRNVLEGT
jgi:hypothetical protein